MIFGRHSVLKRGCSTWDPNQVPAEVFQTRLAAVRDQMARQNLDALVIYGDNYSFADLCYLTNYFPKVRGGIAVVPREGAVSMLLNIGSRDVPFAKTLTWVEDVRASNQVGADGAKLLKEKGFEKAKIGLVDSGQGFPLPQLEEMKSCLAAGQLARLCSDAPTASSGKNRARAGRHARSGPLATGDLRRRGSVHKPGRKEYEIVADIDRLARDKGAEDIRILAGEKRLNPPSFKQAAYYRRTLGDLFSRAARALLGRSRTDFYLVWRRKFKDAYQKAQEIVVAMAKQLKPNGSGRRSRRDCAARAR